MNRIDANANDIYSSRRKAQQAQRETAGQVAAEHAGRAKAAMVAGEAPWHPANAAAIYERRRQAKGEMKNG